MSEEETKGQAEGNQEVQSGQAEGSQGQSQPETNQPQEVELADGTRVSLEELKSGFMKDADYRRKTAEVAEERRRLQAERDALLRVANRSTVNQEPDPTEEVNPLEIIARKIIGLETYVAKKHLTDEIIRLSGQYPEADPNAVFAACWGNPNTSIEAEMARSHEVISRRVAEKAPKGPIPATLEEFFKLNPKAKAEYDKRQQEEYLRKKSMKSEPKPAVSSSSGSAETFREPVKKAASYREVSERLKERLKEEGDSSF